MSAEAAPEPRAEADPRAASPATLATLWRLSPTARRLMACRAVRSIGQGALVVDFALYLQALGWNAAEMGVIYMGGLLFGAALTALSGPLSDRLGRKPFLLGYDAVQVVVAVVALVTAAPLPLVAAAVIGGYGRGANGAAGPFGPVEQAWLSSGLADRDFGTVYSVNAAIGFGGMAIGALAAALPALWQGWLPGALAYRPLFALVAVGSLAVLGLLSIMTDSRAPPPPPPGVAAQEGRRAEHGMLFRLMGINALNGLAIGMIGPFMAFWFHLRFGVGAAAIGPVIALGFALSTLSSLWAGRLTRRLGAARAVVMMRLLALGLFALLPFAPTYGLAAACYVLRGAFNRGSAGPRQVVGLKLVGPGRRGLAASLNAISMQIPRALGPLIGGVLLEAEMLALPMLIAAALQAGYLVLYERNFRRVG